MADNELLPALRHTKPSVRWSAEWSAEVKTLEMELVRTICGAHTKTTDGGAPCTRHPAAGRDRCHLHGGYSPRGINSPHHRNRGYSKDIPRRLAQNMERAMTDPDLSGLKAELALMDARMGDLLAKLPEKHSNETWSAVGRQILAATGALEDGNTDDALGFLANADEALATIRSDRQIWKEIHDTVAERRRLAVEEQKREIALDGTVTAAQFDLVVGAMGASVNEEINSCEALNSDQKDDLLAAVGARFAQTLRYPILEPDTPIPESILDTHLAIEPAS